MTNVGKFIHSAGLFLHNLFNGKTSAHDIINYAEDISSVINIYQEISNDVGDISDPVQKAEAICRSVVTRSTEFPPHLQGGDLTHYMVEACRMLSGLAYDEAAIQKIVADVLAATTKK